MHNCTLYYDLDRLRNKTAFPNRTSLTLFPKSASLTLIRLPCPPPWLPSVLLTGALSLSLTGLASTFVQG